MTYTQASTAVRQSKAGRVESAAGASGRPPTSPCLDRDQHNCQDSGILTPAGPDSLALSQGEWDERFEYELAPAMEARFDEYAPSPWRRSRRIAAAVPKRMRVESCMKRRMTFRCGCRTFCVPVPCGQRWLCDVCKKKFAGRLRARLMRTVKHRRGKWLLVTMTMRHSGDPTRDAAHLKQSWARLRTWLHSRIGKFDYCCVTEATAGRDAKGHVHLHVLCRWPWLDWSDVHRAWLRASRGESSNIDIRKARGNGRAGAQYIAKYASKGCDVRDFPPELAAKTFAAMYMRRMVTTSRGFFHPRPSECRSCLEKHELIERPIALGDYDVRFYSYYLLGPPGGRAPPAWKQGALWRHSPAPSNST